VPRGAAVRDTRTENRARAMGETIKRGEKEESIATGRKKRLADEERGDETKGPRIDRLSGGTVKRLTGKKRAGG